MSDTTAMWIASGIAAVCFTGVIACLAYTIWVVRQAEKDRKR